MISIVRTDSDNPDFIELVRQLDDYLAELDGEDHAFYAKLNTIDKIKHVILAFDNGKPVGCGAIREHGPDRMEVKRMWVLQGNRGKGIATRILKELETWAAELGYLTCILETGNRQPDAIALYKKLGYTTIPNYGKYVGVDNSVCFEKHLR